MSEDTQQRFWHVYLTSPPSSEAKWKQNKTLGIVAPTIQAAIAEALKQYPAATIWTVNHRGQVDGIAIEFIEGWYHNEDKSKGVKH